MYGIIEISSEYMGEVATIDTKHVGQSNDDGLEIQRILDEIDKKPVPVRNERADSKEEIALARRNLGTLPDSLKKLFFYLPNYPDSILPNVWEFEFNRLYNAAPANHAILVGPDWTVYLSRKHTFLA